MLFDATKKVFAILPGKRTPRHKPRLEVANEKPPYGFRWEDDQYFVSRTFGASQSEVNHRPAGTYRSGGKLYDVRVMPPEAVAVLQDYENRLNELRKAEMAFLESSFQTWPIAKRDDFEKPVPTRQTKAEVTAKAKIEKGPSATERAAERRIAAEIGRVFGGGRR